MGSKKSNVKRSDLLYLFSSVNDQPNGDPFTGEQRYDEATSRILISDVRIKRYIRDYFLMWNALNPSATPYQIYLRDVDLGFLASQGIDTKNISGSAAQMKILKYFYKDDPTVQRVIADSEKSAEPKEENGKKKKGKKSAKNDPFDSLALLCKCIDVRLYGGVSTEEGTPAQITGPVQFDALNPSLNKVSLRVHQNTSHFQSSTDNKQGAIGTTSLVPFALNQVVGQVNPIIASETGLTEDEVLLMTTALWRGLNNYRSRSKMGQDSRLLLKINYKDTWTKCAFLRKLIKINEANSFELREFSDATWDFSALAEYVSRDNVESVEYIVEEELRPIFLKQMESVASKLVAL